jgi:hypothetical protein
MIAKSRNQSYVKEESINESSISNVENMDAELADESCVLCNVCFETDADSIFMPCSHGGLCLKCSCDIWKTTNECYLCRQTVQYILRYDCKQRQGNKFKIIEVHQEN